MRCGMKSGLMRPLLLPSIRLTHTHTHTHIGLPVAIKDTMAAAGLPHTMGSRILKSRVAAADEPAVARLRESGAVVVAKSNTPEFACGSHTFNDVFGVTRNPWAPALSAGGSSGGSAAAVAVGSCWLATGSDLGGSLRNPAGWCGVVGLRTTPGLVPTAVPRTAAAPPAAWRLQSVHGPLARCVRDAALMLDAMASTAPAPAAGLGKFEAAVVEAQQQRRPPRMRVAFSADLGGVAPVDPEIADACRAAAQWLSDHLDGGGGGGAGADAGGGGEGAAAAAAASGEKAPAAAAAAVPEACPDFAGVEEMFSTLRAVTCHELAGLLKLPDAARSLVKPECIWQAEQAASVSPVAVAAAETAHDALLRSRDAFFDKFDLLVVPSAIMHPFPAETRWPREGPSSSSGGGGNGGNGGGGGGGGGGGDGEAGGGAERKVFATYIDWLLICGAVSLLGCPAVAFPCGVTTAASAAAEVPIGVSLVAAPGRDADVLAAAAVFEEAHGFASRLPVTPKAPEVPLAKFI